MQLPAQSKDAMPEMLNEVGDAIGCMPLEVHWRQGQRHGLAILPAPSDVQALSPDMRKVSSLPFGGIICAAKGTPIGEPEGTLDFVYRYFAPGYAMRARASTHIRANAHAHKLSVSLSLSRTHARTHTHTHK